MYSGALAGTVVFEEMAWEEEMAGEEEPPSCCCPGAAPARMVATQAWDSASAARSDLSAKETTAPMGSGSPAARAVACDKKEVARSE